MAWVPTKMPTDRHSSAWGKWMKRRKSAIARKRNGGQTRPPRPLTRAERAARDGTAKRPPGTLPLE